MEPASNSAPQTDGASVGDDPQFERRWYVFVRLTWVVLALLVLCGGVGLFGKGPLARKTVGTQQDPLYLKYEQYARFQTPSMLRIFITPAAKLDHDWVSIFISTSLVQTLKTSKLSPQPLTTELVSGGEVLKYMAQPGANVEIDLVQNFRRFGTVRGLISLPGQQDITMRQIIYP